MGYHFVVSEINKEKERNITVSIADKKINKLKKRIVRTLISYYKDRDFQMLKRRLRFLSGLVRLQTNLQSTLYAGNAFNYSELTSAASMRTFDIYIHRLLLGNNSRLEKLLFSLFTEEQKEELLKISFVKGYEKKLVMNYSRRQASKIKMHGM